MATTRHYWVCPRCQTPNAVGVTRCRACDAEAVDPVDSSVAEPSSTGQAPEGPPRPPVAPQAAPAGVARPGPAVTQTVGRRSHSQITRCPRCGMTHQGLVWFCERCGLDILGRGPTSTTTATVTRPTSSRSPVRRLLVLAILLAGFAVASALALLEITDTPGAVDQETPDQAVLMAPLEGSPAPLASAPDTPPAPPATTASPPSPSAAPETPAPETPAPETPAPETPAPATAAPATATPATAPTTVTPGRTISGGLTILAASGASDSLPWKLATADLGTSATQEPGAVASSASPGAVEDVACVGAGAFKQYAPGRAVTILDNGGEVIGSGELQVGTIIPVGAASGCRLPFTIADVPLVASYTFDVGTATLSYSQERLDADDWSVELEIRSGG